MSAPLSATRFIFRWKCVDLLRFRTFFCLLILCSLLHFIVDAQIPVPGKENIADHPSATSAPALKELPIAESSSKESSLTPAVGSDQWRPPLTNLQKLSRSDGQYLTTFSSTCSQKYHKKLIWDFFCKYSFDKHWSGTMRLLKEPTQVSHQLRTSNWSWTGILLQFISHLFW